jgi:hypothetical protein
MDSFVENKEEKPVEEEYQMVDIDLDKTQMGIVEAAVKVVVDMEEEVVL